MRRILSAIIILTLTIPLTASAFIGEIADSIQNALSVVSLIEDGDYVLFHDSTNFDNNGTDNSVVNQAIIRANADELIPSYITHEASRESYLNKAKSIESEGIFSVKRDIEDYAMTLQASADYRIFVDTPAGLSEIEQNIDVTMISRVQSVSEYGIVIHHLIEAESDRYDYSLSVSGTEKHHIIGGEWGTEYSGLSGEMNGETLSSEESESVLRHCEPSVVCLPIIREAIDRSMDAMDWLVNIEQEAEKVTDVDVFITKAEELSESVPVWSYVRGKSLMLAGDVLFDAKRYVEAMTMYLRVTDVANGYLVPLAVFNAAVSAENAGNRTLARYLYQVVYDIGGQLSGLAPKALFGIGRLLLADGDKVASRDVFRALIETYPKSEYARMAGAVMILFEPI